MSDHEFRFYKVNSKLYADVTEDKTDVFHPQLDVYVQNGIDVYNLPPKESLSVFVDERNIVNIRHKSEEFFFLWFLKRHHVFDLSSLSARGLSF